jgi:TPR repeat protein
MIWRSLAAAMHFISIPSAAFAQIDPDLLADAEQGDASAQFNLGLMYDNGEGVPENDIEAVKWYRLAAQQGYAKAQSFAHGLTVCVDRRIVRCDCRNIALAFG